MLFCVPPPSAMLVYILLATWHLDIIMYMCYNIYIRLRNDHSGYILIALLMPHKMRLESMHKMPTIFPTLPTPTEIAFVMMVIGYVITIMTIGRFLINALEWALTQLVTQTTKLLAQYAPRTLLRIQSLAMWPSWIEWKLDDIMVSALERATAKFRAANNRKATKLLQEMEDYTTRHIESMNSKW
jgi:hypothetical protein